LFAMTARGTDFSGPEGLARPAVDAALLLRRHTSDTRGPDGSGDVRSPHRANVANLLLARGAGRAGEFAVRKALGAGQGRLVRQLLTESLLISLSGGGLGILLAWLGNRGLAALAPASLLKSAPGLARAATDWRMLAFAAAVALLTTLLFGLAPEIQSARLGVAEAIKESGRASLESPTQPAISGRARGLGNRTGYGASGRSWAHGANSGPA
jgi:FtsX-like permease family